jgi:hypothetical protein
VKSSDPINAAGRALRARLGLSAQHQARAALDAYTRRDAANVYVHAGIALEHAIKARLASYNVFLVADAKHEWFDYGRRLVFPETPATPTTRGPKVLTVGGTEALTRLKHLDKSLPNVFTSQVERAIERRNEVVHLGLAAEPSEEDLLADTAGFVRAITALLLIPSRTFWAEHEPLAERLVQEDLDAARLRVVLAIAAAKRTVEALSEENRETLAEAAALAIEEHEEFEVVPVPCPVCGSPAQGWGEIEDLGEVDVDWNPDGTNYSWAADFFTVLEYLSCSVCGLRLNGAAELAEGGVTELRVRNVRANESAEFHESFFEPDWERD